MSHPVLSRIPILKNYVDERFLEHRRRSSSVASFAGAIIAVGIFEYRILWEHRISWDLLAIVAAMAAVKMGTFAWYRMND